MDKQARLEWSLLAMRGGVFIVMFMWTLDKFVNPGHQIKVFENFYFISGISDSILLVIGGLEMLILVGFLMGYRQRLTYGLVLAFHSVSTLSSMPVYFTPWQGPSLLFFAAWPMLAACFALYLLRDYDRKWAIKLTVVREAAIA